VAAEPQLFIAAGIPSKATRIGSRSAQDKDWASAAPQCQNAFLSATLARAAAVAAVTETAAAESFQANLRALLGALTGSMEAARSPLARAPGTRICCIRRLSCADEPPAALAFEPMERPHDRE